MRIGISRNINTFELSLLDFRLSNPSPIDFSNMSQSVPKTVKQWNVTGQDGFQSLKLSEQHVPELDHNQVLVKSMSSYIPSVSSVSSLTILQSRVLR